jgi:hypothetical protein
MKLSAYERETVINFNEAERFAEVQANNGRLRTRIEKIRRERPDEVEFIREDEYAGFYRIPKNWIKINPTKILSDEQRAALINNLSPNHRG